MSLVQQIKHCQVDDNKNTDYCCYVLDRQYIQNQNEHKKQRLKKESCEKYDAQDL